MKKILFRLATILIVSGCGLSKTDGALSTAKSDPNAGRFPSPGQTVCGNTNGLPANVCQTGIEERKPDWQHISLSSTDDTKISVDFKPYFAKYREEWGSGSSHYQAEWSRWFADHVWLNISNRRFTGSEHVRVVFIYKSSPDCSNFQSCGYWPLDLTYAGDGRFTAQVSESIEAFYTKTDSGTTNYWQEVAVVVDGNWLTDPVSASHNFKFSFGDYIKAKF